VVSLSCTFRKIYGDAALGEANLTMIKIARKVRPWWKISIS